MTLRRVNMLLQNCRHCQCQFYSIIGDVLPIKVNKSFRTFSPSTTLARTMATVTASDTQVPKPVTTLKEAKRFMVDCLKAVGTNSVNAEIVAENLLQADYRGHYSHGMNRLEMYLRDVQGGQCNPNVECTIDQETVASALVNGNNGFGAVIGKFCMNLAIKKAKEVGVSLVVAHSSNHYGIAGMYALQAIEQGCIGMSVTNSSPFMVPTRGKTPALGTNPISLGAPASNGDSFVLDMATTAVAVGKIELAKRKGTAIPEGWAMNDDGKIETNPEIAFKSGKLMPLGGAEINSGYKGYGLGMFVEVFSGLLAGSHFGPTIRKWNASTELADLGQGFLAIDPKFFAPGFEGRMSELMNFMRNLPAVDPSKPVLVHGDPERIHMEIVKKDGGLTYVKNQHDTNANLAKELKVIPMASKSNKELQPVV